MLVTDFGIVMEDNALQLPKTSLPIFFKVLGRLILGSARQSLKVLSANSVSVLGNMTYERLSQPSKALAPMLVTESGRAIKVNP